VRPAIFPGAPFLVAPGHRSKIVPIEAKAVKYGL
jgi:hypothetical protein